MVLHAECLGVEPERPLLVGDREPTVAIVAINLCRASIVFSNSCDRCASSITTMKRDRIDRLREPMSAVSRPLHASDLLGALQDGPASRGHGPAGSRLNRRDLSEQRRSTNAPAFVRGLPSSAIDKPRQQKWLSQVWLHRGPLCPQAPYLSAVYSDPRATGRAGSELHSDHDPGNSAAWYFIVASAASVTVALIPEPQ